MLPEEYGTHPFWAVPERIHNGDTAEDAVYRAVGHCLTQWETLEIALSSLFAALVESKSPAAARAYGSITSSTGRAEQIKRAGEVFFSTQHQELVPEFKRLSTAVGHSAARRNDVAHGVVVMFAGVGFPGGGYYLIAPTYNSRRNTLGVEFGTVTGDPFTFSETTYAYTSQQIDEFARRFGLMARECGNFIRKLRIVATRSTDPHQ